MLWGVPQGFERSATASPRILSLKESSDGGGRLFLLEVRSWLSLLHAIGREPCPLNERAPSTGREIAGDPRIVLRPLTNELFASFERLLSDVWEHDCSGDVMRQIVRWRYRDRPSGHVTWLACVDDQCVAMLDSTVRPYLLHGRRIMVRETADWYCQAKYRRFGLGLRVLRQLKMYPEPVLVVGGSEMTRQILPRLGWDALPEVRSYVLPVTARGLAANLLRQKWPAREPLARLINRRLPLRVPGRVPPPPGRSDVQVLSREQWCDAPADGSGALVGLLEREHWAWLAAMPIEFAQPFCLVFSLDGAVVGLALAQLEPSATGHDGRIVHLQSANSDPALLAWIVSVAAQALVQRGAGFIRCFVSTPQKFAAVESVGFMFSQQVPCHWWNRPGVAVPDRIDIDYLRGDDAQPLGAMRGRKLGRAVPGDRPGHRPRGVAAAGVMPATARSGKA
jgi:hypothetical protein